MKKEDLFEMAKNPNNIPGIYNYCDRWCERCSFTSRCLSYQSSEEYAEDTEANDISNEKFWNRINENLQLAFEMLQEDAEKQGIDITISEEEAEDNKRQLDQEQQEAEDHLCAKLTKQYIDLAKNWLDSSSELFKNKGEELIKVDSMDLPNRSPESEAALIEDALEAVQWYMMQIHVKTMRGLLGREKDDAWFDSEGFPRDSDGSAKVALIGIDRSIGAWGLLLNELPDEESRLLPILRLLERCRKSVESEFPQARDFVRPGFDEPEKYGK